MGIEYRRKIVKRGNSYSVTIPHEFLFNIEGDIKDYLAVWSYSPKEKAPMVRFERRQASQ